MTLMKNIASTAEIAFWDTAIALMSNEKTRRLYSYSIAALTLRIQPVHSGLASRRLISSTHLEIRQWLRLVVISIIGLVLGISMGWIKSL